MRYRFLPALVSAGVLCCAQGAYAATLTVDDDRADCPAAGLWPKTCAAGFKRSLLSLPPIKVTDR